MASAASFTYAEWKALKAAGKTFDPDRDAPVVRDHEEYTAHRYNLEKPLEQLIAEGRFDLVAEKRVASMSDAEARAVVERAKNPRHSLAAPTPPPARASSAVSKPLAAPTPRSTPKRASLCQKQPQDVGPVGPGGIPRAACYVDAGSGSVVLL